MLIEKTLLSFLCKISVLLIDVDVKVVNTGERSCTVMMHFECFPFMYECLFTNEPVCCHFEIGYGASNGFSTMFLTNCGTDEILWTTTYLESMFWE